MYHMLKIRKAIASCILSMVAITIILPVPAVQSETVYWNSIQVGAFPQLSSAEDAVSQFRDKGLDPYYRFEDAGDKGMWYRIYVGRYETRSEARDAARQMVQQGIIGDYLIRKVPADPNAAVSSDTKETDRPQDSSRSIAKQPAADSQAVNLAATKETNDSVTEAPAVKLSLMDAIRYSFEGNRDIRVVSYEPKKAETQIEGAESVYDTLLFADTTFSREPNLESSVTDIVTEDERRARAGIRKPLKTGGSVSTYLESTYGDLNDSGVPRTYKNTLAPTIELQQPLLNNIGSKKEKTAIKIANHQAKISEAELERRVIEVANRVSEAYWNVYQFKEIIDINRKNLDMAEEVHRREAERHARGISQQLDVERARSNAHTRRSTWLRSKEEYLLAIDRLKLLLNWREFNIDSNLEIIPIETPLTTPIDVDETEIIETALSNRPEIKKGQQEVAIREVDQALAAHQRLPKLDAFGRYSISGYGDDFGDAWDDVSLDDDDAWEIGVEFEWPFGNRLAKSRYHRKSLDRSQAQERLERIKEDIKLEVKQVLKRLATVKGEIIANRQAMEAALNVVEGEFTRFDIGQTTNEELLRAQDLLAVTSRSYIRALADYNTTLQDLTRVQGVLPTGVQFERGHSSEQ